jgi:acetyl esterase/lipase
LLDILQQNLQARELSNSKTDKTESFIKEAMANNFLTTSDFKLNKLRSFLLLLVFGFVFVVNYSMAHGETLFKDPQFKVKETQDIVYGKGRVQAPQKGEKDLLLDVYEPQGENAPRLKPGFIAIHGGGFIGGDKRGNMTSLCRELASRGFVCVSINYRLLKDDPAAEGPTPLVRTVRAAVEDAAQALLWMLANAARYGIDKDRIAIGGSSAGAYTSLFLAYSSDRKDFQIRAVVDLWGGMESREKDITKGEPPVLIIHGTNDRIVNFSNAEAIAKRAQEVGVPYEFYPVKDGGHSLPLDTKVDGVTLYQRIFDFLYKHLNLTKLAEQTKK